MFTLRPTSHLHLLQQLSHFRTLTCAVSQLQRSVDGEESQGLGWTCMVECLHAVGKRSGDRVPPEGQTEEH